MLVGVNNKFLSMTLIINKNKDKFFLALCKSSQHTFVLVGQYEGFVVKQLFCRVAKCYKNNNNYLKDLYQLFSGGFQANIYDEGITRDHPNERYMSYQAYDINWDQYLALIKSFSTLQRQTANSEVESKQGNFQTINKNQKVEISAFIPLQEHNELITLEYRSVKEYCVDFVDVEDIKESVSNYTMRNTCRSTAIYLLEKTLNIQSDTRIPKSWIQEFNSTTYLFKGSPSAQVSFYVLPPPPDMKSKNKTEKQKIMLKLYKRMEEISHSRVGMGYTELKKRTEDKFQAIKNLYQQLAATESMSLPQLIERISDWKSSNKSSLSAHRNPYLWDYWFNRQCTTMKLVDKVEQQLQSLNKEEANKRIEL